MKQDRPKRRFPTQDRPHQRPARPPTPPARPAGPAPGNWLWGHHPVAAALANQRRRSRRLLVTAEAQGQLAPALAAMEERRRPAVEVVDRNVLDRMLPPGSVHQGVALDAEPLPGLDLDAVLGARTLVLLDQVTDPHNVGAILRSAAAFGAGAVVMPDRHAPPTTGTLAKAASGALEMVPMVRVVNLARTIDALKDAGFVCIGLAEEAETVLEPGRPGERVALVLGAEGEGLRRLTRERCDRLVRLPTEGRLASLNVSNAAAVALFALR